MTVHLIWDFDGVFNALSSRVLPGYQTSGTLMFNPSVIETVNAITNRCPKKIASYWLTTRQDDVHELAARIGLEGDWPVLDLSDGWEEREFKCESLRRHLNVNSCDGLVWVDDTLGGNTRDCLPDEVPTIFVAPDGKSGLVHDDLDALQAFLATLSGDTELLFL